MMEGSSFLNPTARNLLSSWFHFEYIHWQRPVRATGVVYLEDQTVT
jgi:hypothetical protein